jgi:hypothetical protein
MAVMKILGLGIALALLATGAGAEPLTGKEAKKLLFAPGKAVAEMVAGTGLSEADLAALKSVAETQAYYGAIALSPDEGMMSEATVAAVNYHDTDAATAAALAECNAKKTGKAECLVVALIRPKGWKAPGFGLSSDATAAFKGYDRKAGAMAISPATGAWGMAAGDGAAEAALADCAAKNDKATDCAVAIAN